MRTTTRATPNTVEEYEALLKRHDWTYQYSDDHQSYLRGQHVQSIINACIPRYDPEKTLYNKYCAFPV